MGTRTDSKIIWTPYMGDVTHLPFDRLSQEHRLCKFEKFRMDIPNNIATGHLEAMNPVMTVTDSNGKVDTWSKFLEYYDIGFGLVYERDRCGNINYKGVPDEDVICCDIKCTADGVASCDPETVACQCKDGYFGELCDRSCDDFDP